MRLLGTAPAFTMKSSAIHFYPGDVLYGRLRPYLNKVHRPHFEGLCSAEFIVMTPRSEIVDGEYLKYFLNSPSFVSYASQVNTGDRPRIDYNQIGGYSVPVPPLDEQRRIVTGIEEHMSRIEAGHSSLVSAQRRLAPMVSVLLRSAVPLPPLPHWQLRTVAEVGTVTLGRQRAPRYHVGPNMKAYLRVANVFEDRIDVADVMEMHFDQAEFERFRLVRGDILLNEGQSPELLGRPAMYRGQPEDVAFTNSLLRFKAGPEVDPEWALLVFRRHLRAGRFAVESRITTNIAHLSAGRFSKVEFPVPPIPEQLERIRRVQAQLSLVAMLDRTITVARKKAQALRHSVLHAAFTGRLSSSTDLSKADAMSGEIRVPEPA